MDYALVQGVDYGQKFDKFTVLILVLMDDALVHATNLPKFKKRWVLILVLMDDALVHIMWNKPSGINPSLNPCFNG